MAEASRLSRLRQDGGAFHLGPRTRVLVTGNDAKRYLSGQLSNDPTKIPPNGSIRALLLTAKGKLCAPVVVMETEGGYLLDADATLHDGLIARVGRYIVADDVAVEDISPDDVGWHVFGAVSREAKGVDVERLGELGRDCLDLPAGVLEATTDEIELLRIERGIPKWGFELDEDTLPHEAGLDRSHVDFHKGCYVGQETVSRVQSVGRTNRILRGFLGAFTPRPGALLDAGGLRLGTITSAARHFELASSAALGYLNTRTTEVRFAVTSPSGESLGECQIHEFPLV